VPLDTILLDLGNVLAFHDNEKLFAELARAFGTTNHAMRERLGGGFWDCVHRGELPGDTLRDEMVRRLEKDLSPERWLEVWTCHFEIHDAMVRSVEALVGRVKLVLVSNTHDQHFAYLRPKLPVLDRFDAWVLSCETGLVKPEPAIHERALVAAGTSRERAIFFDDVVAYADAASKLGIHGRVFTTAIAFERELATLGLDCGS